MAGRNPPQPYNAAFFDRADSRTTVGWTSVIGRTRDEKIENFEVPEDLAAKAAEEDEAEMQVHPKMYCESSLLKN